MKSLWVILLFAFVSILIVFNEDKPHHNQFASDACGYYLYLPATFIYHDLRHLKFYRELDSLNTLGIRYSLRQVNNGTLDKYPIGVAIFEAPLFLICNFYCVSTHQYASDGFSLPYQLAGIFSNIFAVIIGLIILRRFLLRYFPENTVAVTLACIAFGTNLYTFTAFSVGMSHPYSFLLFSILLLLTDVWYTTPTNRFLSICLGFCAGLIVLVRPANVFVFIVPLFWNIGNKEDLQCRLKLFHQHFSSLILASLACCLVIFIQFSYWKYVGGSWLLDPYTGEGFDFTHPKIIDGLFSYRKGWFVYTPMALVAIAGLPFLFKKRRSLTPTLAVYIVIMIYVVFSWRQWWYGGGFGCRPMIESLAILALPLAAIVSYLLSAQMRLIKFGGIAVLLLLICLNVFQTYQYSMGLIHWSRMTKEYYWRVFGKLDFDRAKNEKYLIKKDEENNFDK